MTLRMTLSIIIFSILMLSVTAIGIMTLGNVIFSIMTGKIKKLSLLAIIKALGIKILSTKTLSIMAFSISTA